MNWAQLCKLGRALPEVAEDIWFRTPALKVRGKSFARLKEDGASVVFVLESVEEQEMLIGTQPAVYFITDHYRGWPAVLARLTALDVAECKVRLERGWRLKAPRALVKEHDEARAKGLATPTATLRPTARKAAKRPARKTRDA